MTISKSKSSGGMEVRRPVFEQGKPGDRGPSVNQIGKEALHPGRHADAAEVARYNCERFMRSWLDRLISSKPGRPDRPIF